MAFQNFIPVDFKTIDRTMYKELFIKINETIPKFSNTFEKKYTAYFFIDDYISEGLH